MKIRLEVTFPLENSKMRTKDLGRIELDHPTDKER